MLNGPPARDGVTNHSGWAPYQFGSTGKVYKPPDTADTDVVDDGPGVAADGPDGAVAPVAAGFVVVLVVGVVVLVVSVVVLVVSVVALVVGVVVLVVGVVVLVVGVVVLVAVVLVVGVVVVGVVVLVVGVVVLVVGVVVLVVGVVVLVVGVVVLVVGVVVLVVGVVVLVVGVVVPADALTEAEAPELWVIDTPMVSAAHTTAAASRRAVGPTLTCLLVTASGRGLEEAFSSSNAASVSVRDHLSAGSQPRWSSCWLDSNCDCPSATAAQSPRDMPRQPRGSAAPLTHILSAAHYGDVACSHPDFASEVPDRRATIRI